MKKSLGYLSKKERKVIESFVKDLRTQLGDQIVSITLFGSKIRGDSGKESDIDVLVLIKKKNQRIRKKVAEILTDYLIEYDLPLSPVLYDLYEYEKNKEIGSFFFKEVEKEGIPL
ncbi:MAG: nucleotidyltransferase domain-containing protein [candidate division Zixibacteria bacterium]|nr:nucleotidyltransferase domain-containing protein [candidate division Zixibacteria bacterium]